MILSFYQVTELQLKSAFHQVCFWQLLTKRTLWAWVWFFFCFVCLLVEFFYCFVGFCFFSRCCISPLTSLTILSCSVCSGWLWMHSLWAFFWSCRCAKEVLIWLPKHNVPAPRRWNLWRQESKHHWGLLLIALLQQDQDPWTPLLHVPDHHAGHFLQITAGKVLTNY